jgi:hypothetical protein
MGTTKYAGVHLPSGCTVLVGDDADSLVDIGVIPMETDTNIQISYDVQQIQGSKREDILTYVKNLMAKASTEIYQIRMGVLEKLSGGLLNVTNVAGTQVSGATQAIDAGWAKNRVYVLDGQNASGEKQTLTKVAQGGKTLVDGTDYVAAQASDGGWGVLMLAATTAVTTAALTVTYSYTPAASVKATMGDSVVTISPKVVRFRKEQDGRKFQVTLYSAKLTGGIKLSFPGADNDKPASLPIELEGKLDTSRQAGDQLLEIIDEIGVE